MFLTPAQSIPTQMMDGPALHIENTDTELCKTIYYHDSSSC